MYWFTVGLRSHTLEGTVSVVAADDVADGDNDEAAREYVEEVDVMKKLKGISCMHMHIGVRVWCNIHLLTHTQAQNMHRYYRPKSGSLSWKPCSWSSTVINPNPNPNPNPNCATICPQLTHVNINTVCIAIGSVPKFVKGADLSEIIQTIKANMRNGHITVQVASMKLIGLLADGARGEFSGGHFGGVAYIFAATFFTNGYVHTCDCRSSSIHQSNDDHEVQRKEALHWIDDVVEDDSQVLSWLWVLLWWFLWANTIQEGGRAWSLMPARVYFDGRHWVFSEVAHGST